MSSAADALLERIVQSVRDALGADAVLLLESGAGAHRLDVLAGSPRPNQRSILRQALEGAACAPLPALDGVLLAAYGPSPSLAAGDALRSSLDALAQDSVVAVRAALEIRDLRRQLDEASRPPRDLAERLTEINALSEIGAYEVAAFLSSAAHADEVMERTLDIAARLTGADRAAIMLLDEARGRLETKALRTPDGLGFGRHELDLDEGVAGHVARTGRPYVMHGPGDPLFVPSPPGFPDVESMACVPVAVEQRVLGVLGVGTGGAPLHFGPEHVRMLTLIASRAALAIENARLIERERHTAQELARKNDQLKNKSRELLLMGRTLSRTNETLQGWLERLEQGHRNLSLLYDVNRLLTQTLDQDRVLSLALERLQDALPSGHRLAICLLSDDRQRLFITASRGGGGRRRDPARSNRLPLGRGAHFPDVLLLEPGDPIDMSAIPAGFLERVLEEGEPVLLDEVSGEEGLAEVLGEREVKSLYAWPILVEGQTIGLLIVASPRPAALDEDARRLVGVVAGQLAVAVGNARLYNRALLDKELLEDIIRSMGDGMISMDWEMNVLSMNAAAEEITGWKASDVVGRPATEVFRGAGGEGYGLSRSRTPLADILGSEELSERGLVDEGVLRRQDGTEIFVESIHSLFTLGGVPLGGVAIFRDVTEKVGLAQQKMDYIATLSHDIRTPLSAIKGYALTLARHEDMLEPQMRREFLTIINAEIDRLSRLLDNLLNFSRMEVGHLVAQPSAFELPPVVKRVLDLHTLTTTKHILHLDAAADLPRAWADTDQVEQILNNLVSNAVKYSPDGGAIHVRIEHPDGTLRVEVCDPGVGIAPQEIGELFQRYSRLASTRKVSGTGLGLFITRNLVEAQGGTVDVKSRPGQGSCFAFTLPAATEERS